MLRTLFPFLVGLLLMMLGIIESSNLSTRAVEIGHDTILEQANTRERIVKLGVFGAPLSEALVRRGEETLIKKKTTFSRKKASAPAAVLRP